MRRMTLLFTAMSAALLLGSGTALAALVEGDNGDNTLTGSPMSDIIHAYGAEDLVSALGGRDEVHGGYGTDRLYGGYGDDHLISRDLNNSGIGMRDVLDCGPGYDTFAADYEDRVLGNCEEGSVSGS